MRMCRAWDLAATKPKPGADPDYTAGALVGYEEGHRWPWAILDMVRLRDTPKAVEDAILRAAIRDGHDVAIRMEEEGGASGRSNTDHYARNVLVGYDFQGIRPGRNKVLRANPWASHAQNGLIRILRGPWLIDFLDEIEAFPEGSHDDMVDATSLGFRCLGLEFINPTISGQNERVDRYDTRIEAKIMEALDEITDPEERLEAEKLMRTEGLS